MQVFQVRMKLYLLQNIPVKDVQQQITTYLDKSFLCNEVLKEFHSANKYKNYCYDLLYPCEKDKLYKKDQVYTLTIRTIDKDLAIHFSEVAVNLYTDYLKGLTAELQIVPQKHIDLLYSLTCVVLKDEAGYWKGKLTLEEYQTRMKINLIKKWNAFTGEKLNEDFELLNGIEFLNKCPVTTKYKGIEILGDKVCLHIADNATAQNLAHMSLGTGILEACARGFGFVNYRWI